MNDIKHWTDRSPDDFRHSIAADFLMFLERSMGDSCTQAALAKKLGVTEGRVSQVLNNPDSLSLKNIVLYARAVGAKVALVGYYDGEGQAPVPAEIFAKCWERMGRPRNLFDFEHCNYAAVASPANRADLTVNKFLIRMHGNATLHIHCSARQETLVGVFFARASSLQYEAAQIEAPLHPMPREATPVYNIDSVLLCQK
jgi:transcriptional regulator with XRE-family HTH domain